MSGVHRTGRYKRLTPSSRPRIYNFTIDGPGGEFFTAIKVILLRTTDELPHRISKTGSLSKHGDVRYIEVNYSLSLSRFHANLAGLQMTTNRNRIFHAGLPSEDDELEYLTLAASTTMTGFYATKVSLFSLNFMRSEHYSANTPFLITRVDLIQSQILFLRI